MPDNALGTPDREELRALVARVLEVDVADVTDQANFTQDLGADSLMMLEVAAGITKRFGIRVSDAAVNEVGSLTELHELVLAAQKG
ncbi:acyl carrier protein [Goodfellowiella coeruleoviolacea]|uniref:Acyl carrier protein n=1 Tax=Goodfellowiella coeruleoviolacea TaxID=334858 RepID=A0AAE3G8M3_9PSEU|nr:acyl carrier protein [Goodfellowiella coeruleoviolacea]MCP2163293.1 acyl carrier protein [Goodfellowiella coeruleoviolacea]